MLCCFSAFLVPMPRGIELTTTVKNTTYSNLFADLLLGSGQNSVFDITPSRRCGHKVCLQTNSSNRVYPSR